MKILAIETSCDDTAVAVLEGEGKKIKILSNIVSSQEKLHAQYGGVYPFLAKREHQRNLPLVFKRALRQAQGKRIDAIAVTYGPGLEPCLWQGINFANDLARKLNVPLFPINHIEAHLLANFLNIGGPASNIFPAIGLVVSGGHTQLILIKKFLDYKILGETRDDAAGECFDKVARILGLGYPGGPAIAKLAKNKSKNEGGGTSIILPRPMIKQKNHDFSFSGLKTAVLYLHQKQPDRIKKSPEYIKTMCAEVQQAIIDVLVSKTKKAVRDYRAKTVILGGGVISNDELRKQFKKNFNVLMPPKKFCTDNAAMVAITAYFHLKDKKHKQKIEAKADLTLK